MATEFIERGADLRATTRHGLAPPSSAVNGAHMAEQVDDLIERVVAEAKR